MNGSVNSSSVGNPAQNNNGTNTPAVNNNAVCKKCGKRLPANKYCMYCGCNNKEDFESNNNISTNSNSVVNKKEDVKQKEYVEQSIDKKTCLAFAGCLLASIILVIGFILGGFTNLFYEPFPENINIGDSKVIMDEYKNLFYLKDGQINYLDYFVDNDYSEEIIERYLNFDYLDEVNKQNIIDFDFTDTSSIFSNKMLFLTDKQLIIIDSNNYNEEEKIKYVDVNPESVNSSAALAYFNYLISIDEDFDTTDLIVPTNKNSTFDCVNSFSYDYLYEINEDGQVSYYSIDGYYRKKINNTVVVEKSKLGNKKKELLYYNDGTFILTDQKNIYIVNDGGLKYKSENMKVTDENLTIELADIKHIFYYTYSHDDMFTVITNDSRIYNLELTEGKLSKVNSDNSNSADVILVFKLLDTNAKVSIILILLSLILNIFILYTKMYDDYSSKIFKSTAILGIPLILFIFVNSKMTFKLFFSGIFTGIGLGFILANFFISVSAIFIAILDKLIVNTRLNFNFFHILGFLIIFLLSKETSVIVLLGVVLLIHYIWYVYVSNEIEYNRENEIPNKKQYFILASVTMLVCIGVLICGFMLLPVNIKVKLDPYLAYIIAIVVAFSPSIYLQKKFDFKMFLKMVLMFILMYCIPGIINNIVGIFEILVSSTGEILPLLKTYIFARIILIILIGVCIVLVAFIHGLIRFAVTFISKKVKMEGFIFQTALSIILYTLFAVSFVLWIFPLILKIYVKLLEMLL